MSKGERREWRHARVRSRIEGTTERPRLSVFKSNRYISVQLIDDQKQTTIASATSQGGAKEPMSAAAVKVGKAIAGAAKAKGISKAVFDRGGYQYTGVVKAVAEAAREGGLEM